MEATDWMTSELKRKGNYSAVNLYLPSGPGQVGQIREVSGIDRSIPIYG